MDMKRILRFTLSLWAAVLVASYAVATDAQTGATNNQQTAAKRDNAIQAAALPVLGSGTAGQLTKWTGTTSSNSFIADSVITEDKFGLIGIGTTAPTSKLTVQGMIQTTLGGYKFPDGTVQTTAAVNGLSSIFHDATLKGDGTAASPLGVAVPLALFGSTSSPILSATQSGSGVALFGHNGSGIAIVGESQSSAGVFGESSSGAGVFGRSNTSQGVTGESQNGAGVLGRAGGATVKQLAGVGVYGVSNSLANIGVLGESGTGRGVIGSSDSGTGVIGITEGDLGFIFKAGVSGSATKEIGVVGQSLSGPGVSGLSDSGNGVEGTSFTGKAGKFNGNVEVTGNLSKGGGSFKIDHPLDPENKYLYHSFVESPDMMNIYNGNATTDENGQAVVSLPAYFEALNREFRYQLTVIGQFAQAIVSGEIKDGRFTIGTSAPNVRVSWQVTGIRQDPWANKHRINTEEEKPENEKGFFLHPELYNQNEEKGVEWARRPELMQQLKQRRLDAEQTRK